VGRPSLAPVRREQLLDAVRTSILRNGVDATTVANVAEIAGLRPSHVHHYLGPRDEMLAAAIERALHDVERLVMGTLEAAPMNQRLEAQLDVLFAGPINAPEINQLIDQLIAAAYLDPAVRAGLQRMYLRFEEILRATLRAEFPHSPKPLRDQIAHGILALTHASLTFERLDFNAKTRRHARRCAEIMIASLRFGANS
jgi:AcrR family transcriptional regulator